MVRRTGHVRRGPRPPGPVVRRAAVIRRAGLLPRHSVNPRWTRISDVSATLTASPVDVRSPDWTKVREGVLLRDNHRCVECGIWCRDADADVHHLLPRSAGGTDEPSNLVTLCDGCHAAHHPKLAGRLARRVMERWAVGLALWLDRQGTISDASRNFGAVLRLFGLERLRDGQLPVVERGRRTMRWSARSSAPGSTSGLEHPFRA